MTGGESGHANRLLRQVQQKCPVVETNGISHFSMRLHFETLAVYKMVERRKVDDQPEFPVLLGNKENSRVKSGTFRNYLLHYPFLKEVGDLFFQLLT